MRTKAQKWGNSVAFRVPKAIVDKAGIELNGVFEIDVDGDRIVLFPSPDRHYKLSALLDQIDEDNLHDEVDFGGPAGREAL